MLDEPLGSLDRELRDRLMVELRTLFIDVGLTALFVTHDHDEAFAVSDRVVIMRAVGSNRTVSPSTSGSTRRRSSRRGSRVLEHDRGRRTPPLARPDGLLVDEHGPIGGTVEARTSVATTSS